MPLETTQLTHRERLIPLSLVTKLDGPAASVGPPFVMATAQASGWPCVLSGWASRAIYGLRPIFALIVAIEVGRCDLADAIQVKVKSNKLDQPLF